MDRYHEIDFSREEKLNENKLCTNIENQHWNKQTRKNDNTLNRINIFSKSEKTFAPGKKLR